MDNIRSLKDTESVTRNYGRMYLVPQQNYHTTKRFSKDQK